MLSTWRIVHILGPEALSLNSQNYVYISTLSSIQVSLHCSVMTMVEGSHPMPHKLSVFGISGRTGHELARIAGIKGWEVYGLMRPTSEGEGAIVHGRIVRGNFEGFDRVVETIADSKAVCCVIGPRPPYTDVFCATATAAIITAMKQTVCTRLVCQTGAMIGPAPNRSHLMEWMARKLRDGILRLFEIGKSRSALSNRVGWTGRS